MTNIIAQILELDLHTLEEADQDALLALLRAGHSLITGHSLVTKYSLITRRPPESGRDLSETTRTKETHKIMAALQTTDDQVFTQVFSFDDADQVAVDGAVPPIAVTVVDSSGADVSKWIDVAQDSENPLKFVFRRKPDLDGTQPQDLAFTSIGTATVNGAPAEFRTDLEFTPGAATSLTATVTAGAPPAAPVVGDGASGSDPVEQPSIAEQPSTAEQQAP